MVTIVVALTVAWLCVAPVAYWVGGTGGIFACTFGALVCLFAGMVGESVGRRLAQPGQLWQGWLWGMLLRMAIPLGAFLGLVACWSGGAVQLAACCLVLFYIVMLAAELHVLLCKISHQTHRGQDSNPTASCTDRQELGRRRRIEEAC